MFYFLYMNQFDKNCDYIHPKKQKGEKYMFFTDRN